MKKELTDEVLEALGSCMNTCGDDCKARGVCLPGQSYVRRKLATALLEERAKPKFWDWAPDNAGRGFVNWFDKNGVFIDNGTFTRELPKTRARQIAEQEGHGLAEKYGWNAAAKELVTNKIEAALNKYAEELEGRNG